MKCHTLEVWKRSKELAVRIYKSEMQGAFAKDFSLIRQIQRAAVSICSNIAEGAERHSSKDSAHFYTMAKGSAAELATQLQIAQEIGLIVDGRVEKRILETEEIARMLNSLIKSVKAKGSKQWAVCSKLEVPANHLPPTAYRQQKVSSWLLAVSSKAPLTTYRLLPTKSKQLAQV